MATSSKKNSVQNQPRDRFGRWVSKGANIKWREDGRNKIGLVKSALDGIAKVEERNGDGSPTGNIVDVPLDQVQVLASKARIPSGQEPFSGKTDDLRTTLDDPEFQTLSSSGGTKMFTTPSGYSLEVKDKQDSSPLTYQLYAPSGQSLGIFAEEALEALQAMIDSAVEPEVAAPEDEESTDETVAPGKVTALQVVEREPKNFRVPPKVKQEISAALMSPTAAFSGEDLLRAEALAYDDTVSMSDIKWIGSYFSEIEEAERLRGGFNGKKWASRVLDPQTPEDMYGPEDSGTVFERYDFDDEVFDYFAIGAEIGDTESYALISVDYETGAVYIWKDEGFVFQHELDLATYDAPSITPIDTDTAEALARYIDENIDDGYNIQDTDSEERNLFILADAELDYEEMDRTFAIIADATGYTPQERSANASRQQRGPGGKFGGGQATGSAPEGQLTPQFPKAKLTTELPLVGDISARIEEWIATAPEGSLQASGVFAEEMPVAAEDVPVEATPEAAEGASASEEALYFAIVDEVDKTAVMNAFAIIKQSGVPKAFLREQAKWAESPDVLADVQGSTPPPIVELDSPEPAKSVLAQIDQHDSTQTQDATKSEEQPAVVTASAAHGYTLLDGSLPIYTVGDLQEAVTASAFSVDEKRHIRKRAQALNRMDLVPSEWRVPSNGERGEELATTSPLFGDFGEVLVASGGHRGHRGGNAAALKRYWTVGKGAAKIRWGTKGDLTRAHRHLAKYVGMDRAWGLAQRYHQSLFGVSNYERDN